MEESIKRIIKSVITIIVIIFVIFTMFIKQTKNSSKNSNGIGISSRAIDITISDDKMLCEDVLVFNLNKTKKIDYRFIQENEYLSNVKIYINNNDNFYSTNINMDLWRGYININESLLSALKVTGSKVTIKLTYKLDKNYIKRYTNTDVLPYYIDLENIDYLKNLTINVNSRYKISNFCIENSAINQNDGKFVINKKNLEESTKIDMLFNIETEINNVMNSEYMDEKTLKEKEEYSYLDERRYWLATYAIISVIIFSVSFFINKKLRVNNYRRETSGLVSPILAEAIVDGKIGLKELIMTTIIELNIRGNIKIINNDTLELKSCDNLEIYEKSIIELLFKNNKISFKEINNIFAKSNKETLEFSKKICQIKDLIIEKINSINIFSKELTIVNKVIVLLAILITINLPQIFLDFSSVLGEVFFMMNLFVIIYYIKKNKNKNTIQEEIISKNIKGKNIMILIVFMSFIIFSTLIMIAKYNGIFILIILLISALNIYTAYRSQAIGFTKKGRAEQEKLIELKNYINDYSLIKNRDVESVIVWDEYLAYATAFGIPNRITNTIYEGWYNLNLNLQVVEKILK